MDLYLFFAAFGFYLTGTIVFVAAFIFKKEKLFTGGTWLALLGLLPHSGSILLRWIEVGHGPYINRYEVFSSCTWMVIVFFLLMQARFRAIRYAGPVVIGVSFLLMAFALMSSRDPVPLPPSLESYWLVVHVIFAKLSLGSYLVATGLAATYLLKEKYGGAEALFWGKVPAPDFLDDLSYRFVAFGFVFTALMIVAGSVWGNKAWGRYWGWDPVEIWSLVIWLAYGIYLHLRITYKWKGHRSSITAIICFLICILSFFIMPMVTQTIHSEYLVK